MMRYLRVDILLFHSLVYLNLDLSHSKFKEKLKNRPNHALTSHSARDTIVDNSCACLKWKDNRLESHEVKEPPHLARLLQFHIFHCSRSNSFLGHMQMCAFWMNMQRVNERVNVKTVLKKNYGCLCSLHGFDL